MGTHTSANTGLTVGDFPEELKRAGETEDEEENEDDLRDGKIESGNRQPHGALDDAFSDRVARETSDIVDVELAHEMLPVFVHRFESHAQFRRDLLVGFAFRNQLEDLDLTGTQAVAVPF